MQHLIDELTDDHYKFIQHEDDPNETVCVGLTQPPYEGVVIQYGNMSIDEPEDSDGEAKLSFTYSIVESPIEQGLLDDAFNDYIGAVLHRIVERSLEHVINTEEKLIGSQDRNNDTQESDSQ